MVPPTKRACTATAANLEDMSTNVSRRSKWMRCRAYAVVKANVSTLLAFETIERVRENNAVKPMTAPSLANGSLTKYSTKIEQVGSNEDRSVLIALATATIVRSSYSQRLLHSSLEIGFCLRHTHYFHAPFNCAKCGIHLDSMTQVTMKPWNNPISQPLCENILLCVAGGQGDKVSRILRLPGCSLTPS